MRKRVANIRLFKGHYENRQVTATSQFVFQKRITRELAFMLTVAS